MTPRQEIIRIAVACAASGVLAFCVAALIVVVAS